MSTQPTGRTWKVDKRRCQRRKDELMLLAELQACTKPVLQTLLQSLACKQLFIFRHGYPSISEKKDKVLARFTRAEKIIVIHQFHLKFRKHGSVFQKSSYLFGDPGSPTYFAELFWKQCVIVPTVDAGFLPSTSSHTVDAGFALGCPDWEASEHWQQWGTSIHI